MYTLYTETSSLRTLKITLRNLNVSVGSWIRLQYCDSVLLNSQKKPAEQTVYSYGLIDTSFGFPLFLVDSTFKYIYILHRRIKELASGLCLPPSILFSLILTCLSQRRRLTAIGQKNAPTLYLTISIFARNGGREKNYGSHCHGQNLSSASGQYLIKARIKHSLLSDIWQAFGALMTQEFFPPSRRDDGCGEAACASITG
jgi:hypothetical protein